jgi:hypothetical protein
VLKKFRRSKLFLALLFVALTFVVSGYLLSDSFFFKRLIRQNNITSPESAFAFVNKNTGKPNSVMPVPPPGGLGFAPAGWNTPLEYAPREMLTKQKYLWCDQGASLVATIVRELGYELRIVDFVGDDGISHHTILEVKQQGVWKTYDTTYETQGLSYQEITKAWPKPPHPAYRPYIGPSWIVRNNFYLKQLSLWKNRLLNK